MEVTTWAIFSLVAVLAAGGESANILIVIPFSARSHYVMESPIGLELAKRGHQVTIITAHRENNPPPNYEQIIADSREIWELTGSRPNVFECVETSFTTFENFLWEGGLFTTEVALNSSTLKQFMADETRRYDLVTTWAIFSLVAVLAAGGESANILIVIPFSARSHYVMESPIGLELAKRGHQVTIITAHRENNPPPNYEQIIADSREIWELTGSRPNVFECVETSFTTFENFLWEGGLFTTEVALNSSTLKQFMADETRRYDLVISELFFHETFYMFAHKYGAPLVLLSTYGETARLNYEMMNGNTFWNRAHEWSSLHHPLNTIEKVENIYYILYECIWRKLWYIPKHEALVRKFFKNLPTPIPSLEDMERNAALVLTNSHFSIDTPLSNLRGMIEIGGVQLADTNTTLPKDLQDIMDSADDGVVYVSFGSQLRSTELPPNKLQAFLGAFRRLKQTVLWKWEDPSLPGKPDNVVIRKWFPQKDVLKHPNIKTFITHGGLLSQHESVFYGIPVIGVPIYADQRRNVVKSVRGGFGLLLDFKNLTEESVYDIVTNVLNDQSYSRTAKEVSVRFRDRPLRAIDEAMYWIEYVIRHKGARHMRSPGLDLPWYSYYMLDVAVLLLSVVTLSFYFFAKINSCLRGIKSKRTVVDKRKKKN